MVTMQKISVVILVLFVLFAGCKEQKPINPQEILSQALKNFYAQEKYRRITTGESYSETESGIKEGGKFEYLDTLIFNAPDLFYRKVENPSEPADIYCYKGNRLAEEQNDVFIVYPTQPNDLDEEFLGFNSFPPHQFKILEEYIGPDLEKGEKPISDSYANLIYKGKQYRDNILCDIIIMNPLEKTWPEILKPVIGAKITNLQFEFWISVDKRLIYKVVYLLCFERTAENIEIAIYESKSGEKAIERVSIGGNSFIFTSPTWGNNKGPGRIRKMEWRQEKNFDYGEDFIIPVTIVEETDPRKQIIFGPRIIPPPKKDKEWQGPKDEGNDKPE